MDKNYNKEFEDSLSTLEDIQLLTEFSLSPVLSRAYYHLSELKRKADLASNGQVASFDAVLNVLDEKLENIFIEFFSNKSRFKDYAYSKKTDQIDLKKWNLLLESIPEILSVVSLFNYHGKVKVELDQNRVLVKGIILEDQNLAFNRKFIYLVTRKLLKSNILLTFNLEKTSRPGLHALTLRADISHDENLIYKVQFKDSNILLGFSNIFPQYRVQSEALSEVGEHMVVEINSDLTIKSFCGRVELSKIASANKEILHFSFLFRPLSIILPLKGHLSSDAFLKSLERTFKDTGSEEQNQNKDSHLHYRFIDFFSLFSE